MHSVYTLSVKLGSLLYQGERFKRKNLIFNDMYTASHKAHKSDKDIHTTDLSVGPGPHQELSDASNL